MQQFRLNWELELDEKGMKASPLSGATQAKVDPRLAIGLRLTAQEGNELWVEARTIHSRLEKGQVI